MEVSRRKFLAGAGSMAIAGATLPTADALASGSDSEATLGTAPLGMSIVAERSPAVFAQLAPVCELLQRYGDQHPESWVIRPNLQRYVGDKLCGRSLISLRSLPRTFYEECVSRTRYKLQYSPFALDWATATALYTVGIWGGWDARIARTDDGFALDPRGFIVRDLPALAPPKRIGVLIFDSASAAPKWHDGLMQEGDYPRTHGEALRSISFDYELLQREFAVLGGNHPLEINLIAIGLGDKPIWEMLEEGEVSEHFLRENAINVASGAHAAEFLRARIA